MMRFSLWCLPLLMAFLSPCIIKDSFLLVVTTLKVEYPAFDHPGCGTRLREQVCLRLAWKEEKEAKRTSRLCIWPIRVRFLASFNWVTLFVSACEYVSFAIADLSCCADCTLALDTVDLTIQLSIPACPIPTRTKCSQELSKFVQDLEDIAWRVEFIAMSSLSSVIEFLSFCL